jgi:cob(I)alamin adenosyltransferase
MRMVTLSRIYTKTGDAGETSLGEHSRVSKDHPRVIASGEVDELNAAIGLVAANAPQFEPVLIRSIQNDLFDVGADLCVPAQANETADAVLRVSEGQVQRLEREIDRLNEPIPTATSFILPGGTVSAAWLHLARTVCRRAERTMVTLMKKEPINPQALIYLNRLSDLLFVMARSANDAGRKDVLWVPGKSRQGDKRTRRQADKEKRS